MKVHFLISNDLHTYPHIFKSATFSFRIQLPSTRIRCMRQQSPQLFESALLLDLSFKSYNVCAVKPTLLSFFPCRTVELGAVNELNEYNSAWLGGTILSVKQLLKNFGDKIFS